LPNDAAGKPIYSPGYALLPMLKEPKGNVIFIAALLGWGQAFRRLRPWRTARVAQRPGGRGRRYAALAR
jgi:hypothetical protein